MGSHRPTRTIGVELAGPPPLTPEYQKIFDAIQADQKAGGPGNWPSTFCIPDGMPAMMNLYDPMEIIVTPDTTYILISHNNDSYRRIYTDGRDWPDGSRAHLRGLLDRQVGRRGRRRQVRRARGRDALPQGPARLTTHRAFRSTRTTRPSSRSGIHLDKADRNTLYDEITVIDHALTRPYVKIQKAVRNPDPRPVWRSEICPEDNTWVKIGNEAYFYSADGKLMPSKKDQPPPDLQLFQAIAEVTRRRLALERSRKR